LEVAEPFDFIAGHFQRPFLTVCIECIHCFPFVVIMFYTVAASLCVLSQQLKESLKKTNKIWAKVVSLVVEIFLAFKQKLSEKTNALSYPIVK